MPLPAGEDGNLPSDPEDPHVWATSMDPRDGMVFVKWECRKCGTAMAISYSQDEVRGDDISVLTTRIKRSFARARVHPRCSEVALVREVMES